MTDFLPTICEAAGVALPAGIPFDGRSFLPQLRGEKGRPREWFYSWYAPNQGRVDVPREFAASDRYKLFRNGDFYLVDAKRLEETKLDTSQLDPEAAAARKRLQAVLDQYQNARPKTLSDSQAPTDQPQRKRKAAKAGRLR
jgi:arylsulfatase A